MRFIHFGSTGLLVSPFTLGTGLLDSRPDRSIDVAEANTIVHEFLSAGGNPIDTSDAYLGGRSEEILGDCLQAHRDDVVLASKYTRSTEQNPSPGRTGSYCKAMVQSVEGSLRRLKTDPIDLYFAHFDDEVTPIDEIMRGFDDLVRAGKILYPGLSNFPAWRSAQAATLARLLAGRRSHSRRKLCTATSLHSQQRRAARKPSPQTAVTHSSPFRLQVLIAANVHRRSDRTRTPPLDRARQPDPPAFALALPSF